MRNCVLGEDSLLIKSFVVRATRRARLGCTRVTEVDPSTLVRYQMQRINARTKADARPGVAGIVETTGGPMDQRDMQKLATVGSSGDSERGAS